MMGSSAADWRPLASLRLAGAPPLHAAQPPRRYA